MSKDCYLEQEIRQWAFDRGIIRTENSLAQGLKTVEEIAELISNSQKGRDISDDIGDIYVTIVAQAEIIGRQLSSCGISDIRLAEVERINTLVLLVREAGDMLYAIEEGDILGIELGIGSIHDLIADICETDGLDMQKCILGAYNEISGRTGKMINGVFVKESDLK